ncbi:atrial natriuretic peptide receptor 3 isoform X2 [Frankliniella occidentalis]|uniref:Atrial natriuretic peptide receptor 3 isoform X2 n=1 Tax=Frankliniella occidentalis TaxID=133901 RepID=A0A9C6X0G9_FRAOC|nr:atrial natriuretic peptide receptor 3 isoform X2 [Frankliniella occidentalis]
MVKFWNTPLLTVGALTHDFSQKKTSCDDEYHMLTRVGSLGFRDVALFLVSVMDHYSWRRVMLVYDKDGYRRVSGEHTCKLMMEALVKRLKQHNLQFRAFDTEKAANQGVKEHLRREVGNDFSVVVVCANPSTVREIMLAAEELNMVDSGEYVFFNIELFSSMDRNRFKPWHADEDPAERNERARKAYSALLTVTARTPDNEVYRNFSTEVSPVPPRRRTADAQWAQTTKKRPKLI